MAKKQKFADTPATAPVQETQVITAKDVGTIDASALAGNGEAKPVVPKLPDLFVENPDGVQYKFIRYPLPKRAAKAETGDISFKVDGKDTPAWTTNSKGWAKEGTELTYVYFKLNDVSGYVVLQGDDNIAGVEFTSGEGTANRPNPTAESKLSDEDKAKRSAAAAATREANKAKRSAPAEGETEGAQAQA